MPCEGRAEPGRGAEERKEIRRHLKWGGGALAALGEEEEGDEMRLRF